jgi:Xaa-Pro aminopeptidase
MKTDDELECIRRAQFINEQAMLDIDDLVVPGVRGTELSGAFLRRIFELGATANTVDPIWQVMPPRIVDGPSSSTGDVVFPTPTTDRAFAADDVIWVDTGIDYEGYASDFGCTFVVGGPQARHREQAARWRELVDRALDVLKSGATGMVLVFEPVVWDDGAAGFRAEEIVAVTDDGYERLSARDGGPRG